MPADLKSHGFTLFESTPGNARVAGIAEPAFPARVGSRTQTQVSICAAAGLLSGFDPAASYEEGPMDMKKTSSGFTLVELMISIAVMSVLLGFAVPNLSQFIKKSSVETQAQRLIGSIQLARSEAARLNTAVTICRSTGAACDGSNWSDGWLLFADDNGDGALHADDDDVLRFIDVADTKFAITPTANYSNRVTFRATGEANTAGRFVICPDSGETAYGHEVILSTVGRPRLHKGLTSDCSAS